MSTVGFVKVKGQGQEALHEAISNSLRLIGFTLKKEVTKIIIKPNMCYYFHPSTGDVTDPKFVAGIVKVLRDGLSSNPEISIVESDASAMKCQHSFDMLGYTKMTRDLKINLVNLTNEETRKTRIIINNQEFQFQIPEILLEADLLINVPKIKYMSGAKITCALKNMYGCNAYPKKYIYHKKLVEAIIGINKLVRTDLVLVDGLIVIGRSTRKMGLILSSTDPVATDVAASKLMGINPRSVEQIVLASREGLGNADVSFVGDVSQSFSKFPRKTFKDKLREHVGSLYLSIFS